ncbi:MAG: ABC transporter permease subunit, partial [Nitriliruptoraceae bacterium]
MAARSTTSPSAAARTTAGSPGSDPGQHRGAGPTVLPWLLRQQRRALIGWTIAVAAICAIYVSFYPAMGDAGELEALIEGMPEGVVAALGYDAIGSAPGYLESTIFALLGPILLLVFALSTAARVIAGDEEAGSLELEFSAPISRRSVLLQRYAALVVGLAWLCVVVATVTVG